MFEYYVLNYDWNRHKIEHFNIFDNITLCKATEKLVRKYLKAPNKFEYTKHSFGQPQPIIHGFVGFCRALESLIMWQEWGRREYEISVGDAFETDCNKLEKWDCYQQCEPNIEAIAYTVIRQYKEQIKK